MFSTLSDFLFGFCNLGKCTTYSWPYISPAKFFRLKIYRQSTIFSLFVNSNFHPWVVKYGYQLALYHIKIVPRLFLNKLRCFAQHTQISIFQLTIMDNLNEIFRNCGGFWPQNMCPLLLYHIPCPSKPMKIIKIQALSSRFVILARAL